MKFVFLAGGFAGFLITAVASFLAGHQADRVFFDAVVGCLVAALLFRWFWTILVGGIRETIMARNAASIAAAAAATGAAAMPAKTK